MGSCCIRLFKDIMFDQTLQAVMITVASACGLMLLAFVSGVALLFGYKLCRLVIVEITERAECITDS